MKFYKCVEIEHEHYHAWQSETPHGLREINDMIKRIKEVIPESVTEIYDNGQERIDAAWLHVILYSDEDNALFCVLIGG